MTVTVYRVNPLQDTRWPKLLETHPNASVFHTVGWLDALRRTYGYEPIVFTTSPPHEDLKHAIVFASVRSWITGRRIVSLPFSDHCEPLFRSSEELEPILAHLRSEMAAHHWQYIEIRPLNGGFPAQADQLGFRSGMAYFLHRINLDPSIEAIFTSLDKNSVQRRIRHAERAKLIEECGRSNELLESFYKLTILTRKRHHLPPQPYIWFKNVLDCLGEGAEIRIAYREGRIPVAGILTLHFKSTVFYKYGASDERFKQLGATPLLLWRAIEAGKAKGATEFDLGRSEQENTGLVAFKDKWVKQSSRLLYWRCARHRHSPGGEHWKTKMAMRIFAHLPESMLVAAGRTVYRHIG